MATSELVLNRDLFLAEHWQQKPLLIPAAIPDFKPPISPDEIAGLALEEDVESRIIEFAEQRWQLHHGPFASTDFDRGTPWTLLVQAVDHHLPAVAALRQLIDFLPQWRVDDVMVSYAVDGGSVGPHFDNYDVFLLQGQGQRHWRLGQWCDGDSTLLPDSELGILADFREEQSYLLNPGDILYLPPGLAHWGVAQGECTTFSIGFRAPKINDMVSRWADTALEQLSGDMFYSDPGSSRATRAGEIRPEDLKRASKQLHDALKDFDRKPPLWFGELVTEPRGEPQPGLANEDTLAALTRPGETLMLCPESKLAWQMMEPDIAVFANGQSEVFGGPVLGTLLTLCEDWQLTEAALVHALAEPESRRLLCFLINTGAVYG